MGFVKPPRTSMNSPSPHLFVSNCGPALALPLSTIHSFFFSFGPIIDVQEADNSGCRVIVSFHDVAHAQAARMALDGLPCSSLRNRVLHIQYSLAKLPPQVKERCPVCIAAPDTGIPGLFLFENFISEKEEQELLSAVDERPWQILSKRRVQHYGYEFQYKTRSVDVMQRLGELPGFARSVVEKISTLSQLTEAKESSLPLDQITVNEYSAGVGLSPHIDTHSAFEGAILSLSLAGPCVMEFRGYETELDASVQERKSWANTSDSVVRGFSSDMQNETLLDCRMQRCSVQHRSIFLPERSLLVLMDEARYRWHHYIPHRKVDFVSGEKIQRNRRRVSFTFRKVRHGSCACTFKSFCDSQVSSLCTGFDVMDDVKIEEASCEVQG